MEKIQQAQNARYQGGFLSDIKPPKQVIKNTLRNGKDINEEPPNTTKEADAELTPQPITDKVADYSRKF